MICLPRGAECLAAVALPEPSSPITPRFALHGVRLRLVGPSGWRAEATDGRRLLILQGEGESSPADAREVEALSAEGDTLPVENLIPASAWRLAFKSLPKARSVVVRLGDPVILHGAGTLRAEPILGRFPDTDAVLRRRPAPHVVTLDTDLLAGLLRAIAVAQEGDDSPRVELLFWSRNEPVGFRAVCPGGVILDGLIMPVTATDKSRLTQRP